MQRSREIKKQKLQQKRCSALCCSCRLSVSSSEEAESSANSSRYPSISSIAHAMVQERLDQMIKERQEARNKAKRRARAEGSTKFIVMVAMEKSSYDPRQDFRDSIEQVIRANRISQPRDLRRLLDYYVSVNSEEYQALILEVFYDVCSSLFTDCKRHFCR